MSGPRDFARQVGLIAAKDLKIFTLDRGALIFSVLMPFVFVILFSVFLGNAYGGPDKAITVYVATAEPAGSISQGIAGAMVAAAGEGSAGGMSIERIEPDTARDLLARSKIGGYLFFPEGFSDAVRAGRPAGITVYVNPEARSERAALMSVAGAIASEFESNRVFLRAIEELSGGSLGPGYAYPPAADGPLPGGATAGLGVNLVYEKVGDIEPPRPADVLIPGYLTMFVFFALALTAETLLGEKENYTLERLVAGRATRLSIIAGKIVGAFGRGLIQVVVFWTAGVLFFHVRMGHHPVTVVGVSLLLTLAASGVGVFIAAIARTRRGAGSVAVFTSLSFAAFGGSWWPLFIMPQWLQNLAKITPHAWANSAFNKLMIFGATPANVVPEMIALGLFALVFGGLAVWRFQVN